MKTETEGEKTEGERETEGDKQRERGSGAERIHSVTVTQKHCSLIPLQENHLTVYLKVPTGIDMDWLCVVVLQSYVCECAAPRLDWAADACECVSGFLN